MGEALPDRAEIPPITLVLVTELGERAGLDTAAWFEGLDLSAELLGLPETKVSLQQAREVVRRALRALPPGPVGLQIGMRDVLVSWGMLGLALRTCETGAQAIAMASELHLAAGSLADFEVTVADDGVVVELVERTPDPELLPFLCEEAFGAMVALTRAMFGAATSPRRIELTYPRPGWAAAYDRVFQCPVRFGAEANRLIAYAAMLDASIATRNPALLQQALVATRQLLPVEPRDGDIVAMVDAVLAHDLRRRQTLGDVAAALHVSERTLSRRLQDRDQRFSEIRDRVRCRRATELLQASSESVGAIAAAVGFRDSRDFARAYRRWTGQTPRAARAAAATP